MKKTILLVDESLTVQKVVALTLDRKRYQIHYAKTRRECIQQVTENTPHLILISDQVTDITIPSFPKEVESWLGRQDHLPPIVLMTGQDIKEVRNYAAVLKKPFSPQGLQNLVLRLTGAVESPPVGAGSISHEDEYEDQRLQKIFNETFNDEAALVKETFEEEMPAASFVTPDRQSLESWGQSGAGAGEGGLMSPASAAVTPSIRQSANSDLWSSAMPSARPTAPKTKAPQAPVSPLLSAEDSMAYKAVLESKVEDRLQNQDLDQVIGKILDKMVPPIVERLVQERLDALLKDQEQFIEMKPD